MYIFRRITSRMVGFSVNFSYFITVLIFIKSRQPNHSGLLPSLILTRLSPVQGHDYGGNGSVTLSLIDELNGNWQSVWSFF